MKILCIGRNYADHAKELNNPVPTSPVVFLKPDTAILRNGENFYYPEFSKDIHYECELVIKISKSGKYIDEKFALNYFNEISAGIDFTARDIQNQQKEKGLPWEIAKAFDSSAPIGDFISINTVENLNEIEFSLKKNGQIMQKGNSKDMIFSFAKIIAFCSQYFTLKVGDLIYTGTPLGVGPISTGDVLETFIGDKKLLQLQVK